MCNGSCRLCQHRYCVGDDQAGNLMIVPSYFQFVTTPDATAPTFVSTFPRLAEVTDSSVKLDVQLDEPGASPAVCPTV